MSRQLPWILLVVVVLLLGFAPDRGARGPYEYKFVRVGQGLMAEGAFQPVTTGELGEDVANVLAREGWELHDIASMWVGSPGNEFEALTMVFRRPRR